MANMFDDARKRLKEKNDAVKVRSNAKAYSSEDMFDAARNRLKEKQTGIPQTSQAAMQSKVEIPQVSAGSSVADLLPKPNEAERRNYAAMMQQKAHFGAGNVDLYSRPQYKNADGSVSTVDSRSYNIDGKETLLPSVWMKNGKAYHSNDDNEIVQHYYDTGEYLGKFDTVAEANDYAEKLHQQQERYYAPKPETPKAEKKTENATNALNSKITEIDKQIDDTVNKLQGAKGREKRQLNRQLRSLQSEKEGYAKAGAYADVVNANVGKNILSSAISGTRNVVNEIGNTIQLGLQANVQRNQQTLQMLGDMTGDITYTEASNMVSDSLQKTRDAGLQPIANFGRNFEESVAKENETLNAPRRTIANVAQGVGGMIPSIIANQIVPGSGLAVMSVGAAGGAYDEAKREGADDYQAYTYGVAAGLVEAVTEKIADGVSGVFGKGAADEWIENSVKNWIKYNPTAQQAVIRAFDLFGEGAEEFISEYADAFLKKAITNTEDRNGGELFMDALRSFGIGALVSGVMQAGGYVAQNMNPKQAAQIAANNAAEHMRAYSNVTTDKDASKIANSNRLRSDFEKTTGVSVNSTEDVKNASKQLRDAIDTAQQMEQETASFMRGEGRDIRSDSIRYAAQRTASEAVKNAEAAKGINNVGTTTANTTRGGIVLPTASERGMLPTYAQSTELNAVVQQARDNNGEVTSGMVERVMKNPAMMQEIGMAQNAAGSAARAEVKSRLETLANTENRDIINGTNMAQQIGQSADAENTNRFTAVQNAAEEVANNGERGNNGTGEGSVGLYTQRSGVEAGRMDGGAETLGAGNPVVGEAERAGGNRQEIRSSAKDAEVISAELGGEADAVSLGIEGGDASVKVRLIKSGSTRAMRNAENIAQKNGHKITAFATGYLTVGNNKYIQAASLPNGDIVVSADDPEFEMDRLVGHEVCEDEIRRGGVSVKKAIEAARKTLGDEKVNSAIEIYKSLHYEVKELICDAAGNMNRLAAYADGNEYISGMKNDLDEVLSAIHEYVNVDGAYDDVPALIGRETQFSSKSDNVSELEANNERKENDKGKPAQVRGENRGGNVGTSEAEGKSGLYRARSEESDREVIHGRSGKQWIKPVSEWSDYEIQRVGDIIIPTIEKSRKYGITKDFGGIDETVKYVFNLSTSNEIVEDIDAIFPGYKKAFYIVADFLQRDSGDYSKTVPANAFTDNKGKPIKLYHGGGRYGLDLYFGAWFTPDKGYAEYFNDADVKEAYAGGEKTANIGELDGDLQQKDIARLAKAIGASTSEVQQIADSENAEHPFDITRTRDYISLALKNGYDSFEATESGIKTYCVFGSKQQIQPLNADEVQFSMAAPVEEVGKLLALHNMTENNLRGALELGGLPMPSIAVVRADTGHTKYGPISVVFDKSSIDPQTDYRNKVYGGDAWTPTAPAIEYEANETAAKRIRDKYYSLARSIGYDAARPLYNYANDLENTMNRNGGESGIIESLSDDTDMMNLFLADSGKGIVENVKKETVNRLDDAKIEQYDYLIQALGKDVINELYPNGESPITVRKRWLEKHGFDLEDAYRGYLMDVGGISESEIDDLMESPSFSAKSLVREVIGARDYLKNGAETRKTETDVEATKDAILKATDKDEYSEWLKNLFHGIEKRKGIYNGKDPFTSSGNSRSWGQLHSSYTLENIVSAMRNAQQERGQGAWGVSAKTLQAVAAPEYNTIQEIRNDSRRLGNVESEEYDELVNRLDDQISRIIEKVQSTTSAKDSNRFIEADNIATALKDAASGKKTVEDIVKRFSENGYRISNATASEIQAIYRDAANLPTEYFEAKPQRAVKFDEALAVVAPSDIDNTLKKKLIDAGANVITYAAGDETDRLEKVNSVQGARFSSAAGTVELKALQQENKRLQTRLDEAKRQTTLTTTPTFTDRTIARAANNLIRMVGSDTKADEIKPRIKEFFEYMANDPTNEGMQERAYDIASDLVDNAKEMVGDDVDIYNRMAGYLRDNKLFLSKEYRSDVNYKEFVKNNPKVKMSSNGVPVDVAYQELQEIFGEGFFPTDVIHPADQLEQIADVLDSLKPFYRNPYSLEMAQAYNWAANAVIDEYFDAKEAPATFADKAAKKLESQANKYEQKLMTQQANYEDALTKQEADYEAKLARQKENLTSNYEDRLAKQEADYEAEIERRRQNAQFMVQAAVSKEKRLRDEKISALKEHYQSVNERKRELKQERNDREKLRKIVKRLQSNKIDPVTKSMLPAIVRELDATAVNLTDKSVEKLSELRQWYDEKTTKGSDIYDPNFIPDKATVEKLKRLEKAMNGKTIGQMTILEVRELTEVLQNIEYQMHEGKNFQQSKVKKDNYEAGLQTIQDIENARPGKINRELSPQRAARRIAGYNDGAIEGTEASPLITLMDETVEGERKADIYQRDALHVFKKWLDDKGFMRGLYGRKAKEIMITGVDSRTGETRNVAITPAMRISLYLHSMNDDNMRHIQEGGVVIPAMNLYKKGKAAEAYAADIRVKLTKTNVAKICEGMSETEKRFANAVWRYFNEYAPKRLNEASVLIDGYEKFNVENYFPISVDSNFLSQDYESVIMEQDGSLTHPGFGEERIQSAKPIYLRDVNDVFMTAVRTNSMYACQAVPLMNLSKLINVQQVGAVDSVTAALNRKFTSSKMDPVSTSASDYLAKYMRDYAGNKGGKKSGTDKLLAKVRSNYSGGVLTLAAGTAIKQAASYPTAAAVTSTRSLLQAMNPARTVNTAFIDDRTAAFTKRTEGLSTVELAEMTQDGNVIPKALNWIQAVDVGTTALLKRAAAIEIQRTTNLKLGTEEYEKAVTDLYVKIIEETQPNYSVALRPDILRSDSALERALVMFATQPMQNYGILYDAIGDYRAKSQAYAANKSKATENAKKAAGKKLGNAIGSQITASLVFSLMQYLYDAFRKKDEKYKNDEGETTLLSFMKGIGINMLSNGAGMLIAGKVALELGETATDKIVKAFGGEAVFNSSIYGFEVAELSAITDAVTSAINAAGAITSELYKAIDKKDETKVSVENLARKTWAAAEDALILFGIPLQNVTTMLTSTAKQICTGVMGKYVGGYYALRISTNPEDSKKPFYDLVWDSIRNGTKTDEQELLDTMLEDGFDRKKIQDDINGRYYDKIWENRNNRSEMIRWYREAISHGTEPDNIKSSMESRMKKDEGVDSVTKLKKRWDDIIK